MACTIVSTPATGAADWTGWITQQGLTDRGFMQVSLTNFATTAASLVGTGSVFELAGSIYSCTETAINLAAGTISAAVAVYYVAIPSAGGTTCTFTMDSIAPTWVNAKQGYYASAASTSRYLGGAYLVTATSFQGKWLYKGQDANDAISRMRVTKNDQQLIPNATATVIQYDDVVFDNLGEFASYRYTAKETGYRFVCASLSSEPANWDDAELWQISIYKNGAIYSTGLVERANGSDLGSIYQSILSDVVYLAATDYIDIRGYQTQGANINTSTVVEENYFAVHRLS